MKKIFKGHYEYTNNKGTFKIEKLHEYPELDWRIFNKDGEWLNTFYTRGLCKEWLDNEPSLKVGE